MQRRQVLWQSGAKVKRSNFCRTAEMFADICPEDIETVTNHYACGDNKMAYTDSECCVLRLMKEVKLVNWHVPGSNAARLAMRNEICVLMLSHGLPSFFITINPADVYNPLIKFLAGEDIGLDNLLPTDIPDYWDQSLLVAKNPVVAAKFFNLYINTFIKSILGYDPACKTVKSGVLGICCTILLITFLRHNSRPMSHSQHLKLHWKNWVHKLIQMTILQSEQGNC